MISRSLLNKRAAAGGPRGGAAGIMRNASVNHLQTQWYLVKVYANYQTASTRWGIPSRV